MRFAAISLSVFFAVSTAAGAVAPSEATETRLNSATSAVALETLLERARLASGAPYRFHVVSRSHETRQGRTFEITSESQGATFRTHACVKGLCSGSYFDGEHLFETDFNETPLPASSGSEAVERTFRAITSYAFTAPDFRAEGGELYEREPIALRGRDLRRITVIPPHGEALDALIDPATALVQRILSEKRHDLFQLDDQRRVDGRITLPFSITLNGADFERFESRSIADLPLAAPTGLVPTIVGDAAPLAMQRSERATDQPVVPCSIGGQAVTCLLDTGNSGLSMSLELAEQLGLEPQGGAFDIRGVGTYLTGIVIAPPLTVGEATYPSARYVILHDLHRYGYDVVLGTDAFARARITIDYAGRRVAFAPLTSPGASDAIPIVFENFIPVLSIAIGDAVVPLAIDTGDESSINLTNEYYEAHPTIFTPNGSVPVAGIGGTSDEITGEVARVRIGGFEIERARIGATKRAGAMGRGHVGSGFLRHFSVTFDYAHGRIELVPRAHDSSVHAAA